MRHLRTLTLMVIFFCVASLAQQSITPAYPRIATITLDSSEVPRLQLRPGYVTSIFLPEEINAIVLGDPSSFRAEHSEGEPRLVTVKPVTSKTAETNLLVTTKAGREVALHLVSKGRANAGGDIDFVLQYEQPASVLIPAYESTLFIPDTKEVELPAANPPGVIGPAEREL